MSQAMGLSASGRGPFRFCSEALARALEILKDRGPAGAVARLVLPLAVAVPVAVSAIDIIGQTAGLYDSDTGVRLQLIADVVWTLVLLTACIGALHRADRVRRERETAIERSEARYRLAEAVAGVGHWRMDAGSRLLIWSAEMYRICAWPAGEGEPTAGQMLKLYHPDDRALVREALVHALKTGEGWALTIRLLAPSGGLRYVKSHGVCERAADGDVSAVFGVFVDITELETARLLAEQATDAKATFLANMSHEIRTPLNGILGFADLLLSDPSLSKAQRSHVGLIQTAGCALLTVVNDILDLSKIEAGKVEIEQEPFAVEALVDNSVSITRGAAEAKGVEVRVQIGAGVGRCYAGDEGRLRQVLLNFLSNAVKFTHDGTIILSVDAQQGQGNVQWVRFSVEDTGIGISPERQHRLFQQFSQADTSISRDYGGTGLGLAICKSLVELMGGEIGFNSTVGRGSTFWFEVPLSSAEKAKAGPTPSISAADRPARILLVEDLAMNRELAVAMLSRAGHQVEVATDGSEAIAAVTAGEFDLILMDVQMPRMDGLAATQRIRALERDKHTPIIALTANILPDQLRQCREAGMDDHVSKPIRPAELLERIDRLLARHSAPALGNGCEAEFDHCRFREAAALLPADALARHLLAFDQLLAHALIMDDAAELAATMHKIVAQGGMLGFAQLEAACRALEEACENAGDREPFLNAATAAIIAARVRLQDLMAQEAAA